MMILIADSGSTKTHWCLVTDKMPVQHFFTQGFNPYVQDENYISSAIAKELIPQSNEWSGVEAIYYYGAGCSSASNIKLVSQAITGHFSKATIEVEHDLLAAARALCGKENGVAAILGTGSNSCLFENGKITDNVPALGYVLGDEGSGAYMGKKLMSALVYREMPGEIETLFLSEYKLNKELILDAVYKQANPNRFLASFGPFIFKNQNHPFVNQIIRASFSDFFERQVCKYREFRNRTFNSVGSIGFSFAELLKTIASENGMKTGKILKSPMEGLLDFHSPEK